VAERFHGASSCLGESRVGSASGRRKSASHFSLQRLSALAGAQGGSPFDGEATPAGLLRR
jgi:hypothetical protein